MPSPKAEQVKVLSPLEIEKPQEVAKQAENEVERMAKPIFLQKENFIKFLKDSKNYVLNVGKISKRSFFSDKPLLAKNFDFLTRDKFFIKWYGGLNSTNSIFCNEFVFGLTR